MGLDQYAFARWAVLPGQEPDTSLDERLAVWRKHNRLHGWMEDLYYSKGGTAEVFNCVEVELTLEDLDALQEAIGSESLPERGGFFFGGDSYDTYDGHHAEEDKKFLVDARKAINKGKTVYYDSWW